MEELLKILQKNARADHADVAKQLGLSRRTLHRKLNEYGLRAAGAEKNL